MSFRFREMERCRIQLQPQSYHGKNTTIVLFTLLRCDDTQFTE